MQSRAAAPILLLLSVACTSKSGTGGSAQSPPAVDTAAAAALGTAVADSGSGCLPNGRWSECSALKRLEDAGLVAKKDSAPVHEQGLSRPGIVLHPARGELELFFYPDTAARRLDEAKLDRKSYIEMLDMPTLRNEWTIIRAWNMLGLLRIPSSAQRERIWNALMAGPPQPPRAPPP